MSEFEKLLGSYQARVNQKLEVLLPHDDSILTSAMRYSVLNGGKRLRPILAYLTAELNDTEAEYMDTLASSLELIHCYSLIHDDLPAMDDDELRRGNPTTHKKFDEATAILAGDALQPFAFELISTIKTTDRNIVQMISSLSEACGYLGMVGGQIKDINSNQIKDVESLDSMHSEKTGRLIQASIETAGILSGLSTSDIESLKEYGGKIGLAFQIQDDIIDIESPASVSGKDQGSDIGKDKTTYPSLVGLEASKVRAQELSNDAKKILQPINKNTDNLDNLADYIVSRKA